MPAFRWAGGLALLPLLAIGAASAADRAPLVDHVRTANGRFKEVSVAVSEGYTPIPCASGVDGGAMGIHYVNAKLIEANVIDIEHPQAVMYQPMPDGKMMLIAVEYITSKGPALPAAPGFRAAVLSSAVSAAFSQRNTTDASRRTSRLPSAGTRAEK